MNNLLVTFLVYQVLVYLVEQEVENQDFLTWAKNHSGNSGDLKILKEKKNLSKTFLLKKNQKTCIHTMIDIVGR